ncbi:MAG TPA: biopolymer transporter ExbD [Verrucomicrobiae bacterium]|nr:biopolymer transporter ExbD [Verrucomicrobiae bacterium]
MRFFIRKRRQPPAVIIVALIDVLIVVLIFLMVTTTFKKPQPSLKLALPESSHSTKTGASEAPPLVVSIEENGVLHFGPDAKPYTPDDLKKELIAASTKNPQLKLTLRADTKAPFGRIVKVMDIAKEANIKMVDAFTKPSAPQ